MHSIVAVTGGAGFIGSHLVDLLLGEGFSVRIIDNLSSGRLENLSAHKNNPRLEVIESDIRHIEPNSKAFSQVTRVFHLAGIGDIVPSIENPSDYLDVNVQGTVKVLEASRFHSVKRFVYAASSSCYGIASTPTNEGHQISPQYPYALSKYLGEVAAFHWGDIYKLPVNSICIFNAYGPRVKTKGVYGAVFGVFFKQHLAGYPLTVVGDGNQRRDFVHVKDVARAFFLASETTCFQERFNIGSGNPRSILELAQLVGGKIQYIPKRPGEPEMTFADISKAKDVLGWTPEVSFHAGVAEMLESISDWNDAPLWDVDSIRIATHNWFQFLGDE